jgi:hypothetical protein
VGLSRGAFSVGVADGVVVVVVVVVVVEVSGAFCCSFAHAADSPTNAMMAAAPAMAGIRRDVMFSLSVPRLEIEPMRFVIDDFIRIANLLAGNAQGLCEGRTGNRSGAPAGA